MTTFVSRTELVARMKSSTSKPFFFLFFYFIFFISKNCRHTHTPNSFFFFLPEADSTCFVKKKKKKKKIELIAIKTKKCIWYIFLVFLCKIFLFVVHGIGEENKALFSKKKKFKPQS